MIQTAMPSSMDKTSESVSAKSIVPTESSTKLLKNFSWWSLIGISFSLTNSWLGVSSSLVVGLYSGGPLLIIYGLIIGLFFTFMCGWSLSEFSSLLPNSSGSSFWVLKMLEKNDDIEDNHNINIKSDSHSCDDELKLEKYCAVSSVKVTSNWQRSVALTVGLINYFGAVFTTASVCSSLSLNFLGVYSLVHPAYEIKHWHVFLTYEILNVFFTTFNCWSKWLPAISQFGLYMSMFSFGLTFVISLVCRSNDKVTPWPTKSSIFSEFSNTTGWSSSGMAFIVGLINPLWAFAGIDSATHMVDEVGHSTSRTLVPRAIIGTVLLGFVTSFTYSIGMFYCITDTKSVVESILPILQIYYQATGNRNLSIFLQCCCITSGVVCGIASGTWQSRILWSISRDFENIDTNKPRPVFRYFCKRFGHVNSLLKVPLTSHLFSQAIVAIIGCIFMGSTTAFNAIITACITLLLLSYAIPCSILLVVVGKRQFYRRIGQELDELKLSTSSIFHSKNAWFGYIANGLTIAWALFCLIFLSFPYTLPVSAGNMNYVSVVYGAIALVISVIVYF